MYNKLNSYMVNVERKYEGKSKLKMFQEHEDQAVGTEGSSSNWPNT